jgi:hypothetical protein
MTWYAVYQLEDGRLVSGTGDPTKVASPAVLAARGYGVADLPDGSQNGIWDPVNHVFNPAPAGTNYDTWQWIALFTPAEIAAIRASTDQTVQSFLYQLSFAPTVFTGMPEIVSGLAYLVSVNLLTAARAAVIGA